MGCAQQRRDWARFDGRSVGGDPALERQGQIDLATCRAAAINAGNQVAFPAPAGGTQNTTVNVYANPSVMPAPPTPPSYQAPQVDFSGIGDIGATIGAQRRQSETQLVTMEACMAQRGYRPVDTR